MPDYIEVPIDTDPQDVLDEAYAYLQSVIPGWTPSPGQLDVWLLMSLASTAAQTRDVASAVSRAIFRWFGANLISLPPIQATPATSTVDFTMVDNQGYTVPGGTQLSINRAGDLPLAFLTTNAVVVPPGSTVAAAVPIQAVIPGVEGSGLGSVGEAINLEDPLAFISTVTLNAVTGSGVDDESDDDYLARLATQLELLAPRPIVADDFAVFARNIPGVARATALDGYDPLNDSFGNIRMVAVAAIDALGQPVSAPVKAQIASDLQTRREVNFVVNVIDPTYTAVDVTYDVVIRPGFATAGIVAAVNAALASYLDASNWGVPNNGRSNEWENQTTVRYLEVAQTINDVDGVDYITGSGTNYNLQIALSGDALARQDITLPGRITLPLVGTLIGTAN